MTATICLAISAFRSDDSVLALLENAAPLVGELFAHVVVVDSLGTGRIGDHGAARGWTWLQVIDAPTNLGSAGNLALRLQTAAARSECTHALAINHDGHLDDAAVRRLLEVARSDDRIGAVYPLRRLPNYDSRYDLSGTRLLPPRRRVVDSRPAEPVVPVHWSSSNGALYALAPVRDGCLPDARLWMGWEDLGFGWQLEARGWRQLLVTDAGFEDSYEFAARRAGSMRVSRKPAWYAYYSARNLILISGGTYVPAHARLLALRKIAVEALLNTSVRPQRLRRLRLMAHGIWDGLRGRTGMRVAP